MTDRDSNHPGREGNPSAPPDGGGAGERRDPPGDRTAAPPGAPTPGEPGVLRATRTWLLPREIRDGFETALSELCSLALDAGMRELDEPPALALARALVADLENALAALDELEQMVRDSRAGVDEMKVLVEARALADLLTPPLDLLRERQQDFEGRLAELKGTLGPGTDRPSS